MFVESRFNEYALFIHTQDFKTFQFAFQLAQIYRHRFPVGQTINLRSSIRFAMRFSIAPHPYTHIAHTRIHITTSDGHGWTEINETRTNKVVKNIIYYFIYHLSHHLIRSAGKVLSVC